MLNWRLFFVLIPTFTAFFAQTNAIGATSDIEIRLNGTIISPTRRSALVNGEVVHEGDHVDGVEILAIEKRTVRVSSGSKEYVLRIGGGTQLEPASVRLTPTTDPRSASIRKVKSGDTLSGISVGYTGGEVSLNQVMVALFDANPQAFDGNINRLRAGALLRIPEFREMRRHTPETAMAKVQRQTETWRTGRAGPVRVAQSQVFSGSDPITVEAQIEADEYGPVLFGETLSEIAVEVSGDAVPISRMMTALFEANPHAFGRNIDLLHEGAVLRVPGFVEINKTTTLTAYNH